MKIGVPKEIKNNENRVGMTPAGVFELIRHGHTVNVQSTAGEGSGFFDKDYLEVGATILNTIKEVYASSMMIIKVKEPIPSEYPLIQSHHVLFTYFHFASSETLTLAMLKSKAICIAYETVEDADGSLPLLTPM
jgi:alanine dehydrogenase